MKKIFKGLSILVASTALCGGIAMTTACNSGYDGKYEGSYHYTNEHNAVYGMRVEVTVKNNIITKVRDITNTDLSKQEGTVRIPVEGQWGVYEKDENGNDKWETKSNCPWTVVSEAMPDYGWDQGAVDNWTSSESYLLQKYEGLAVSDVLDIQVFIKETGEPYSKDYNAAMGDLLLTGATQSSGRLLLAVQDALGKKTEIGRIG